MTEPCDNFISLEDDLVVTCGRGEHSDNSHYAIVDASVGKWISHDAEMPRVSTKVSWHYKDRKPLTVRVTLRIGRGNTDDS